MNYHVTHTTTYAYAEPVSLCQNVAHLVPRASRRQRAEAPVLAITPDPAVIEDRTDFFGNPVCYFTVQEPHTELVVDVEHRVAVFPEPPPADTPAWEAVRDRLPHDRHPAWRDAYQFAFDSRFVAAGPRYAAYAAGSFAPGRPVLDAARDLMGRVHAEFAYDPQATTLATPVAEVFEARRGVCQDFAHFMLSALRSLGLAARYASGYLATDPPPGAARVVGADATHAWVSLFCGDAGWVDLDPTNDTLPADRHILLAWGRDYEDVSPLKGVILGGGAHTVTVKVNVRAVESALRSGSRGVEESRSPNPG